MTKIRPATALGIVLLLFVGTYGPAFLAVAFLKLPLGEAIPVIIVISLAAAILLIGVICRRTGSFAEFGFRFCHYRYIVAANRGDARYAAPVFNPSLKIWGQPQGELGNPKCCFAFRRHISLMPGERLMYVPSTAFYLH